MKWNSTRSPLQVLLVGNNPIELSAMLDKVNQLKGRIVKTEIAFDMRTIVERLLRFRPNFVLIDDNIGSSGLRDVIDILIGNKHTRNTPITVVKNSNYVDLLPGMASVDFILKAQLTAEALYNAIRNSLKLRRTRKYLYHVYRKRKIQIIRMLR